MMCLSPHQAGTDNLILSETRGRNRPLLMSEAGLEIGLARWRWCSQSWEGRQVRGVRHPWGDGRTAGCAGTIQSYKDSQQMAGRPKCAWVSRTAGEARHRAPWTEQMAGVGRLVPPKELGHRADNSPRVVQRKGRRKQSSWAGSRGTWQVVRSGRGTMLHLVWLWFKASVKAEGQLIYWKLLKSSFFNYPFNFIFSIF